MFGFGKENLDGFYIDKCCIHIYLKSKVTTYKYTFKHIHFFAVIYNCTTVLNFRGTVSDSVKLLLTVHNRSRSV